MKERAKCQASLEKGRSTDFRTYSVRNFRRLSQMSRFSDEELFEMEVVANVLPFRVNNYVVDELIDWEAVPDDPIFVLTFPQRDMLLPHHFNQMAEVLSSGADRSTVRAVADRIRWDLNPHPAGQIDRNVPAIDRRRLPGIQHKYRETLLLFPSEGQTCHAYCTFCFRWPQFVGISQLKFAMRESDQLVRYLRMHPEVSDVLFTGGDPMIMRADVLSTYVEALLTADLPNVTTIRIGSKSLGYWPYRFLTDRDANDMLNLFMRIVDSGRHLAFMANFTHPRELRTDSVREAIRRIRDTGAEIRTQSPLLAHINDDPAIWVEMWREQVLQGCVPYYMFVVRDTGAQHFFGVTLAEAWTIYQQAYQNVSGICRTVRGPSMSTDPGKVQVLGVQEVEDEKVFVLRFLQSRNPDWVLRPFFARYDSRAIWLDELEPAFSKERFFFEDAGVGFNWN